MSRPRTIDNAFEQALDFVERRVAGAAGAHDAVRGVAEARDDGRRVEVAVRDEDGALGERRGRRPSDVTPRTVNETVGVRGSLGGGP